MTVDEDTGLTYVGSCPNNYPAINYPNVTQAVYIVLPDNITQLNSYMCGAMNREGKVCGECQKGYGPAVHQAGFLCVPCHWYGIPVYLLLEIGPVTLFYVIILLFRISLTSVPMISFVIYCQMVTNVLTYNASIIKAFILHVDSVQSIILHMAATLGGIWNLDFLKFVTFIPPVCVSEKLSDHHIILLNYISAIYPQVLIGITLLGIRIYNSQYGKCLNWICKPIRSRHLIILRRKYDEKNTVADVFTTFLVLSYSKLVLVSLVSMAFTEIQTGDGKQSTWVMTFDTTIEFLGPAHMPIALIGLLVAMVFGVGPPLFLLLHPTGKIQVGLQNCKLNRLSAILDLIARRFQADYRDGTNGGPKLTYLAGMYMVVASASYFVFLLDLISPFLSWFGTAMLMIIVALFILSVRPHKEAYMNTVSGSILALPALYCIMFVMYVYNVVLIPKPALGLPVWILCLLFNMPQVIFIGYIISKPARKSKNCQLAWKILRKLCCCKKASAGHIEEEMPDRMEHPEYYERDMPQRTTSMDDYTTEPNSTHSNYEL